MLFWLGFGGGVLVAAVLFHISARRGGRREGHWLPPDTLYEPDERERHEIRNFLYYDGTEMPKNDDKLP